MACLFSSTAGLSPAVNPGRNPPPPCSTRFGLDSRCRHVPESLAGRSVQLQCTPSSLPGPLAREPSYLRYKATPRCRPCRRLVSLPSPEGYKKDWHACAFGRLTVSGQSTYTSTTLLNLPRARTPPLALHHHHFHISSTCRAAADSTSTGASTFTRTTAPTGCIATATPAPCVW